jgi:hypothetical protein
VIARSASEPRTTPRRRPRRTTCIAAILLGALATAACSNVPPRDWPEFELHRVTAEYRIENGQDVEVPASAADLTVLSLEVEPKATEVWRDGRRWLVPPAGCDRLVVTCQYRVYARDGALRAPQLLFPGATVTELAP